MPLQPLPEPMATRPLDILIVGAGPMARHHAFAVGRVGSDIAQVCGFVDPDGNALEQATEEFATAGFTDLGSALASLTPDVVHVCSPPRTHALVAKQALRAGAHLYVEKPFVLSEADAREILTQADQAGLKVAAGHQLLKDPATIAAERYLPGLGRIVHVESYFAFKPRREVSGKRPRTTVEQLLDILPHPTYLLAHFMEIASGIEPVIDHLATSPEGWTNVVASGGGATGSMHVTLVGRPVNSYVRLIGTGGSLHLDYVRGIAIPKLWQGSGLDKVMEPYHEALVGTTGSTRSLIRRVVRKERSYPGLRPMFEAFYESVCTGSPSPVSRSNINFSVRLVEQVALDLASNEIPYEAPAASPTVMVTGGTGFLGREVVRELVGLGETPLAVGRRLPPATSRQAGAHYAVMDLSAEDGVQMEPGIKAVVHCAAETAGSWEAHQRNSIDVTARLLEAAQEAGVERFLHVSSLGVVSLGARAPISEDSPVEDEPKSRGAYVWGKLESERLVEDAQQAMGMETSIIRPGPLMHPASGPAPGRLGRGIGSLFVAIGPRRGSVPTTDVTMAGRVLAEAATGRIELPKVIHLLDPEPKSRRMLITEERKRRPGLRVIWLPWIGIRFLSGVAFALQKLFRPTKQAIRLSSAFAAPRYDTTRVARVLRSSTGSDRDRLVASSGESDG